MRKTTVEFVLKTPVPLSEDDVNFNVKITRTVPADGGPAHMTAVAYLCDPDGNYDSELEVMTLKGVDTLELQYLLKGILHETAQLTNVHIL
jgi:hypothetical protein